VRFFKGYEGFVLILSGILSILIHIIYYNFPNIAPHAYFFRTEVLASHLLLSAGYYLFRNNYKYTVNPWVPVVAFFIGCLCYTPYLPMWSAFVISPFMLAFALNHLSDTYQFIHSFLSIAFLRFMGVWSYSLYLWQQPFSEDKGYFTFGYESLAIIPAMSIGLLSFYLFENPIRTWLNKNW
jgi:peptidoglycan/LPS O-acetylase OafA/YrhL